MRRYWRVATLFAAIAFCGSTAALAQVTASDSITVTANNQGIFLFSIAQASFDFGSVDATGATNGGTGAGVVGNGRLGGNDGGSYTASNASAWTCSSAPQRTVKLYNVSTTSSGALPADRLQLRVPAAGGGTSQSWKTFSTTGTPAGDLITGMTVRNGANSVTGQLDLQLTVMDVDPTGASSWTVVLTASGT